MSYASNDPATRLAEVRAAISRCLTSQAYSTSDGRNQQVAMLRDLRQMEKELQDEVAQTNTPVTLGVYER